MMVTSLVMSANDSICYKMEVSGTLSDRTFASIWLMANCYGMGSVESRSGYLRAGTFWQHDLKKSWKISAGLELAGAIKMAITASPVW